MHFPPDQNNPGLNFRPHEGLFPDDKGSLALYLPDELPFYLDGSIKNQFPLKFASLAQDRCDFRILNRCFTQGFSFLNPLSAKKIKDPF